MSITEYFERVSPDSLTRGHRYKIVHPVFGLMLDNISLQFALFQFGILFHQMLLKPS